jgi:hypothetical protein
VRNVEYAETIVAIDVETGYANAYLNVVLLDAISDCVKHAQLYARYVMLMGVVPTQDLDAAMTINVLGVISSHAMTVRTKMITLIVGYAQIAFTGEELILNNQVARKRKSK